tara:strand:- start:552 stop:1268 length:717 start_codon:yes stop_codon:yes gene_type:complete
MATMNPLDYGRSFVIGNGPENEVRFWVESRTRLIDDVAGTEEDYLQCASCKSEATFAARDLFQDDNYDFLPVFGPIWGVVFRRKAYLNQGYRETRPAQGWWNGQRTDLVEGAARELETNAVIREATYSNEPIVAQTEIKDSTSGLRAIIESPVKTMNTNREQDMYQVDTGPVLLPDLKRHERSVDGLRLAFVAFNVPHFADFVVEVPTTIGAAPTGTEVHHYSERINLSATNRLYAVD